MIEHIVLLNFRSDVDSTKVESMIKELDGLASLDVALQVSAGKILRMSSTSSSLITFTHLFRCCFRSADDKQIFSTHPDRIRVATQVRTVIEHMVVVDLLSNTTIDSPNPGSAMKVRMFKLKDDLIEDSKLVVMEGIKNELKAVEHIRFGHNIHVMAKGYLIAMIAFFPDLESPVAGAEIVKDYIESELVVDFVFPPPNVTSLS